MCYTDTQLMTKKYYIGIDVGGTKILGGVVSADGEIFARHKVPTPKEGNPKSVLAAVSEVIAVMLSEANIPIQKISGMGVGIPGMVDTEKGKILVTANLQLSGDRFAVRLQRKYGIPVTLGNDVNLGVLGESWLGSAKGLRNVVGIFPGTGVGGGIIVNGQLMTGAHGSAAEVGHMLIDPNGPKCSCGNRGCLEAFAGRWAIERDIRKAVADGKKTIITELTDGKLRAIKSKLLKKALKKKDPVVVAILRNVSHTLGLACVSLRHLYDPELIVFGGGVIEACGEFMMPLITSAVLRDPFFAGAGKCRIVTAALGDDAVMLGAVALAKEAASAHQRIALK